MNMENTLVVLFNVTLAVSLGFQLIKLMYGYTIKPMEILTA